MSRDLGEPPFMPVFVNEGIERRIWREALLAVQEEFENCSREPAWLESGDAPEVPERVMRERWGEGL